MQPIPNTLIFVSSTKKQNLSIIKNQSNEQGLLKVQVQEGEYLVKALLKEFEFDPPSRTVEIKEG